MTNPFVSSVIFAVTVAATALTNIAPQIIQLTKAASAAGEIFKVIDREPEIDALAESGLRPSDCKGDIRFTGVDFAYPSRPHVPVLRQMNLTIEPNKTTALVGASGSGKSTITGLIERWYNPNSGSVTLDGHEISDLNIQWLRTNIRIVQQVRVTIKALFIRP